MFAPGVARILLVAWVLHAVGCSDGAGGSLRPPTAPQAIVVENDDGAVDVTWTADPVATTTTLRVLDTTEATATPAREIVGVSSPFRVEGLGNGRRYEISLYSSNPTGVSGGSPPVQALPGPVPAAPKHVVAIPRGGRVELVWQPVAGATSYRIYGSASRAELTGKRRPSNLLMEVTAGTSRVQVDDAKYYRVQSVAGARVDRPGFVAQRIAFDVVQNVYEEPRDGRAFEFRVRGNLHDWNGDGCLDLVIALGDCAGRFVQVNLAERGLAGLFAPGRVNGDTRFADFDGDGVLDAFTNVYSRADARASSAMFHRGRSDGTFAADLGVADLAIGGFGETLVVADFDNDGDVDLLMPHYWHRNDGGRNWLLRNDGHGRFVDMAEHAGVMAGPLPLYDFYPFIPEGAQALDFDGDGWLDFYLASALYVNRGDGTFIDERERFGLPVLFDEGIEFVDVDLDGDFDLVHNAIHTLRLFRYANGKFGPGEVLASDPGSQSYGLKSCDLNADGYPEIVWASVPTTNYLGKPHVFLNVRGSFERIDYVADYHRNHAIVACGDLDRNGTEDLVVQGNGIASFVSVADATPHLRIRVLDTHAQRNQFGRRVTVRPVGAPELSITRLVDGGSGYHTQGDYDLVVAAPWPGDYDVFVSYADGVQSTRARANTFVEFRGKDIAARITALPGER